MRMAFLTREDTGAENATDTYAVQLTLPNRGQIRGTVNREPRKVSSILGREQRPLQMRYDLAWRQPNGSTSPWKGVMPIQPSGEYTFAAGSEDRLKIGSSLFGGNIQGKPQQGASSGVSAKLRSYVRWIRGKQVKVTAQHLDPLEFRTLQLAAGPSADMPAATVTGRLDYDYDTGNWYTDRLEFRYSQQGVERVDIFSGSIRWKEDPQRKTNGKGTYELNLRLNDAQSGKTEDAYFATPADEEAFFDVESDIPGVYGSIAYHDTYKAGDAGTDDPTVVRSVAAYQLQMNGLTAAQYGNFLKLWFLIIGPMNDE